MWKLGKTVKRRVVGLPGSEGKVYISMYNSIPVYDLDMLWPDAVPNPTLLDVLKVVVPFVVGFVMSIYKIIEVRVAALL
jgi:hypothetical protein